MAIGESFVKILFIGVFIFTAIITPCAVKLTTFESRDIGKFQLLNILGVRERITDEVSCCRQCRRHNECKALLYHRTSRSCTLGRDVGLGMTGSDRDLHLFVVKKARCPVEHGYQEFTIQEEELCVKMSSIKLNYTDARGECQKHGGDLYHMDGPKCDVYGWDRSKIRRDAVPIFSSHYQIHALEFWIGLNDIKKEGTYVWEPTGNALSDEEYRAQKWKSGEPNNYLGNEDCILIHYDKDTLNDDRCARTKNFLCEVQLL